MNRRGFFRRALALLGLGSVAAALPSAAATVSQLQRERQFFSGDSLEIKPGLAIHGWPLVRVNKSFDGPLVVNLEVWLRWSEDFARAMEEDYVRGRHLIFPVKTMRGMATLWFERPHHE